MTVIALPRPIGSSDGPPPLRAPVPDEVADDALSIDELGARIVGMAGRLASAMCRWLLLVAAFDARGGSDQFLLPTTARWLSHYCSLSRRTAVEHVRVARALAANPSLAAAMSAGRISFSHARAITRVTELGDADLVADLVMVAEHGTVGQLEDMVRGLRTVERNNAGVDPETVETVSHRWRDDSYLGLSAKLDPEHGALVLSAVDAVARREGISHPAALTRLAEIALASLNADDGPAPSLRGDEYAAVVVHLDASKVRPDAAPDHATEAEPNPGAGVEARSAERGAVALPYARIARGPGLPDATVQRLLCTGRIRAIVTTDGEDETSDRVESRYRWRRGVLDIGANRRLVSDKTFRALLVRDGGCCTVPGCGSRMGLEAHHVRPWFWGGKTIMANLVLLCRAHHHALHHDAFRIQPLGKERFRYLSPDGRKLPERGYPGEVADLAPIEDDYVGVAPDAATTRWDGSRLDRDYAVAALAQRLPSSSRWRMSQPDTTEPAFEPWALPPATRPLIA
jgi:hypothetical protein